MIPVTRKCISLNKDVLVMSRGHYPDTAIVDIAEPSAPVRQLIEVKINDLEGAYATTDK
jgi:hypothetical protein